MKKMSTTQQQLTLSLKLSLLLTESGTSVDGWFGSSWSKWIACTKKGSHLRNHLAVLPPPDSLSDHLGTWWGRGFSVRICEYSTMLLLTCPSTSASHPCQARSGCRWLQRSTLHQRWSQWQRPSECWKKNTQNTTQAMRVDRTGAGFMTSSLSPVEERLASQIVVDEGGHRSYLGTTKPHLR